MIRDFMNGREVHWNDEDLQLKWVREELPAIPGLGRRLRAEGARGRRSRRRTA